MNAKHPERVEGRMMERLFIALIAGLAYACFYHFLLSNRPEDDNLRGYLMLTVLSSYWILSAAERERWPLLDQLAALALLIALPAVYSITSGEGGLFVFFTLLFLAFWVFRSIWRRVFLKRVLLMFNAMLCFATVPFVFKLYPIGADIWIFWAFISLGFLIASYCLIGLRDVERGFLARASAYLAIAVYPLAVGLAYISLGLAETSHLYLGISLVAFCAVVLSVVDSGVAAVRHLKMRRTEPRPRASDTG
jgi:hypothetical protein